VASLTRAEIADRALELIGVKVAGQAASAEDFTLAGEKVDAAWAKLRKLRLAPFALSAVPEWAQSELVQLVAFECAPSFGIGGERLQAIVAQAAKARTELSRQVGATKPNRPVQVKAY
jgi:hypothetical protein